MKNILLLSEKRALCQKMAEREGFEPSLPFQVITLSRRAPSTTQPPLHQGARIVWKAMFSGKLIGFQQVFYIGN